MKFDFPSGKKIAAAVSGGVDSMVMLELFLKAGVKPLVVTIDHGIRGDDSAKDAEFVKEYAEKNGLECLVVRVDVPSAKERSGLSTELQARLLRYEVFDTVLNEKRADVISLAHHLSDQTETLLMRMMRGTGVSGLRGILDRTGYIHPLIGATRAEIEEYAFRNSVPFREDKTNLWDDYFRNFVRNRVLPVMKQRSPKIDRQFEKLAASAKETEDFIEPFLRVAETDGDEIVFSDGIFDCHDAVLKRSVVRELKKIGFVQDLEEPALKAICDLKNVVSGSREIGKGYVAVREYNTLSIGRISEELYYEKPFSVTETYDFGYRYSFIESNEITAGATFDLDKIPADAVVRTRREGDRFRRYAGGDKSLSDYFTDTKTPKKERGRKLLVATGQRILAILGEEISEEVKCDENTKRTITVLRRNR